MLPLQSFVESLSLTGEAKPHKSLVVGQSGISEICEQTSVSSKHVCSSLNCCHMVFYACFGANLCLQFSIGMAQREAIIRVGFK